MNKTGFHLVDPITRMEHYLPLLSDFETRLQKEGALGLLVIHVAGMEKIEEVHGKESYDRLLGQMAKEVEGLKGKVLRDEDTITMADIGAASFMIFLGETRPTSDKSLHRHDVEVIADRVQEHLFPKIFPTLFSLSKTHPKLNVGYSFIVNNPLIRPRHLLYRLVDEARDLTRHDHPRSAIRNRSRLQKIILNKEITSVFQPIVNLHTGKTFGYEALARGPMGSIFEAPMVLFTLAEEVGLLTELDRLCREKAMKSSGRLSNQSKLFINTLPKSINDPEFRGDYLDRLLKTIGKHPSNIVFEITERSAIENFSTFRESIGYYRDLGMQIAIDDIGTGYSSLEAIVELEPDYLKFDMGMVKGIGESSIRKAMLQMLSTLAKNIHTTIIAEGIEAEDDLKAIRDLGVTLGQGFLIGHPMTVDDILNSDEKPKKAMKSS